MGSGRDLNIERVFVGMRRAWHPPSSAIEASFTRLTATLSGIFARLQSDDDLAPLHTEIYAELRPGGPETGPLPVPLGEPDEASYWSGRTDQERFRKAFYLCNAMIQLMEDVYHDLRLEQEYRHPDNHGWINLFRRWSRAETFRKTWAVSAPTYGLRFQDFCQRQLGLELGRLDLVEVWHRRGRAGFPDARARELLEAWEIDAIRVLKRSKTRGRTNPKARAFRKVVAGRLVVPGASPRDELRLTYGVAILDDQGRVLSFWVREHLRNRGLGRALMRALVRRMGVEGTDLASAELLRRLGLPAHRVDRIDNLFKSAFNEVELEASRRAIEGADAAEEELAPLPVLRYTGFIRPAEGQWAHALALLCWLIAWLPDADIELLERREMKRILKGWLRGRLTQRELDALLSKAQQWSRDRGSEAMEAELEAVLGELARQPWFQHRRYGAKLEPDLLQIAWADTRRSQHDVRLIRRILKLLDIDPPS